MGRCSVRLQRWLGKAVAVAWRTILVAPSRHQCHRMPASALGFYCCSHVLQAPLPAMHDGAHAAVTFRPLRPLITLPSDEAQEHHLKHAMPKLHRHQTTRAARVSIPPSVTLTRPPTAQIGRARRCLLRACRRSEEGEWARRERVPRWYGTQGGPPEACHAKAAPSPGHQSSRNEHPPIGCSPTASHGSKSAVRGDAS